MAGSSQEAGTDMPAVRPLPWPDPLSEGYWDAARKHELHIQRCAGCYRWTHQPAIRCNNCGSLDFGYQPVSGRATLHSWTTLHDAPAPGFASMLPLIVGVVELVEQSRLLMGTNIVGIDETSLRIGMPLEVTFDDIDEATTLIMFKPAER